MMYEHIRRVEEDYDNLYKEINSTHPYAVIYYHKQDGRVLGYEFDLALNKQYVKSVKVSW